MNSLKLNIIFKYIFSCCLTFIDIKKLFLKLKKKLFLLKYPTVLYIYIYFEKNNLLIYGDHLIIKIMKSINLITL